MLYFHDSPYAIERFIGYVYLRPITNDSVESHYESNYISSYVVNDEEIPISVGYRYYFEIIDMPTMFEISDRSQLGDRFNLYHQFKHRNICHDPWHIQLNHELEKNLYGGVSARNEIYIKVDYISLIATKSIYPA
jgi:hypothetical protein